MTSTNDNDPFNLSIVNGIINNNNGAEDEIEEELNFGGFGGEESREGADQNDDAMALPRLVKPPFPDAKTLFNGSVEMNVVRSLCLVA